MKDFLYTISAKGEQIITPNLYNISIILEEKIYGEIKYDTFSNRIFIDNEPIKDIDIYNITVKLQADYIFLQKINVNMVHDAIKQAAFTNRFNSGLEFILREEWDGVDRIDSLFVNLFGCDDTEYARKVSGNFFKSIVARVLTPGCKCDNVTILEGSQGKKKSTFFTELVYDDRYPSLVKHVEHSNGVDNVNFIQLIQGVLIVEFAEGETNSKTDAKKMKAIISTRVDRARFAFAKSVEDYPRTCVFAMSVNDDEYLRDETGNRRYFPIRIEKDIDIEYIRQVRHQLFAEAYHRLTKLKESYWEVPEKESMEEQLKRQQMDDRTFSIITWYKNLPQHEIEDGVKIKDIYNQVFLSDVFSTERSIPRLEQVIISSILRTLGFENRVKRKGKEVYKAWFLKEGVDLDKIVDIISDDIKSSITTTDNNDANKELVGKNVNVNVIPTPDDYEF